MILVFLIILIWSINDFLIAILICRRTISGWLWMLLFDLNWSWVRNHLYSFLVSSSQSELIVWNVANDVICLNLVKPTWYVCYFFDSKHHFLLNVAIILQHCSLWCLCMENGKTMIDHLFCSAHGTETPTLEVVLVDEWAQFVILQIRQKCLSVIYSCTTQGVIRIYSGKFSMMPESPNW